MSQGGGSSVEGGPGHTAGGTGASAGINHRRPGNWNTSFVLSGLFSSGGSGGTGGLGGVGPTCTSTTCGDGCFDPATEECDDGNTDDEDACSNACKMQDVLVYPGTPPEVGLSPPGRHLGHGRHPVAASSDPAEGFVVAHLESDEVPPILAVSHFTAKGERAMLEQRFVISGGSTPTTFADPVVAALPGGFFAAAWTDFNGDGDELGIALKRFDPAGAEDSAHTFANQMSYFSQRDPDMIWTGSELVVAWVDDSDPLTAPDLYYRRFDENLAPLSEESALAVEQDAESQVAMAPAHGEVAFAYRASVFGDETIHVKVCSADCTDPTSAWTVGPLRGSIATDLPAIVEVDSENLLLVFTEGTDPDGDGLYNTPRLRGAVLNTMATGAVTPFDIDPMRSPYNTDATLAQTQPNVAKVAGEYVVTWRSASAMGRGEELWIKALTIETTPSVSVDLSVMEQSLPRDDGHRFEDQRLPALAVAPYDGGEAVAAAWVDYGRSFGDAQGKPDVLTTVMPKLVHGTGWCAEWEQIDVVPFVTVDHPSPPDGTSGNPYRICNGWQLKYIAHNVNAFTNDYIELHSDIDAGVLDRPLGGKSGSPFAAYFNGRGHVVRNFTYTYNGSDVDIGLFGQIAGRSISNLNLENIHVTGGTRTGLIAGHIRGGTQVTNVHVDGSSSVVGTEEVGPIGRCQQTSTVFDNVTSAATVSGVNKVGGLVGQINCTVKNSSASGAVTGSGTNVGGFVGGVATWTGHIEDCSAYGSVTGTGGATRIGGFVGVATEHAHFSRCAAHGDVTSDGLMTGGFVGRATSNNLEGGGFRDSFAVGDVVSDGRAGGFVGYVEYGNPVFERSWASGSVTATGAYDAGGFLGASHPGSRPVLRRVYYHSGTVSTTGSGRVGGLAGVWGGTDGLISEAYAAPAAVTGTAGSEAAFVSYYVSGGDFDRVYYRNDLALPAVATVGTVPVVELAELHGLSDAEMKQEASFPFWDFDNVWDIATAGTDYPALLPESTHCDDYAQEDTAPFVGMDYPTPLPDGSAGNPYRICNAEQLNHVRDNLGTFSNKHFELHADIDGSELDGPIGGASAFGPASFDGRGHAVFDFTYVQPTESNVGVFGYASGDFSNLRIVNAEVSGASSVGAFAGRSSGGTYTRIAVDSNSTVTGASGHAATGGVVGDCTSSSAVYEYSHSAASVSSEGSDVGGFAGRGYCALRDSVVIGSVTGVGSGATNLGGFVGNMSADSDFSDCSSAGVVSAQANNVGGFVGKLTHGLIERCSSSSDVSSTEDRVGGFAGYLTTSTVVVRDSFATGEVAGDADVGGFLGYAHSGAGATIERCFATGNVDGAGRDVGGFAGELRANGGSSDVVSIDQCYFHSGTVEGNDNVGGFVGYSGPKVVIHESYAAPSLLTCSSASTDVGSFLGVYPTGLGAPDFDALFGATDLDDGEMGYWPLVGDVGDLGSEANDIHGATDANLKLASTYTAEGWDFMAVWQILTGDYPSLQP